MRYKWWASLDRFWLHVPVGLATVFLAWLNWTIAAAYVALFLAYELNEDHHVRDEAWRDLAGAMAGILAGGLAWAALR